MKNSKYGTAKNLKEMLGTIRFDLEDLEKRGVHFNLSPIELEMLLQIMEANFCDLVNNRLCVAVKDARKGIKAQKILDELAEAFRHY